jgi:propionyl-CoA carboxylase alpha chain
VTTPVALTKLLVANRAEIAARVIRSARRMGVATVAVFSDADAGLPYVAGADEAVHLPGVSATETYLSIERLLEAARRTGADAVHPGYGFLSESAPFARACAEAGLCFVGPPPDVIEAMGSKVLAKAVMSDAGVPVLPGVTVDDDADLAAAGRAIGVPLLVKAVHGGGGRGMRVVTQEAELGEAVASARREAQAAFGDGTVFLERFVPSPRHVEVQVFGDTTGNVVPLFERDCSVQRRYQKIVEECPSPAVDADRRQMLAAAAVTAAKAIGYVGAGTVEFVVDGAGAFYFLEVNTRLQVEHPVTEAVTGLDLVELQLRVARGEPLPTAVVDAQVHGHAVEARLYAEDVAAGFVPVAGALDTMSFPAGDGIRVDAGYASGSVVSTYYDAMLAKVIAWGPTRPAALERLATALAVTRIHGVTTNRDLLVAILRHPEFAAGQADTGFLDRHPELTVASPAPDRPVLAAAAALADQARRRAEAPVQRSIPSGWRNVPTQLQRVRLDDAFGAVDVGYDVASDGVVLEVDLEAMPDVRIWEVTPTRVDLSVGGVRRCLEVEIVGDHLYVDGSDSAAAFRRGSRFPGARRPAAEGSLVAPLPGTVARVLVEAGTAVEAGAPLVVLEAMKMEHQVRAPWAGTVAEVAVAVGTQVEAGTVLAVVIPAAPGGADLA